MYIGIDSIPLATPKTGIGHYTFELARGLALAAPDDEFELVSPFPVESTGDATPNSSLPANLRTVRVKAGRLKRRWWTIGLPLYVRQATLDLFHGTNYSVPLWNSCPTVVTIHDLTLFLYPETFQQHILRRARRRLPIMARTATMIVTPSEQVRREVCEHLNVNPDKVIAIPEAARPTFYRADSEQTLNARRQLGVEDEFVLFVGTIEPRKNLLTLVRAFEEVLKATPLRPQLVIAGGHGWQADELYSYVRQSGIGERVLFTGYVADEDLRALYSSCRVCVYPSLYEGFGLPPLEAMACGAPVVTSRIPSIIETVGTAARLVAPTDVYSLAQAIADLLKNEEEQRHLSAAGMKRAAQFTWEQTARATLDVYHSVLSATDKRRGSVRRQRSKTVGRIHKPKITVETLADKVTDGWKRKKLNDNSNPSLVSAPPRIEDTPPRVDDESLTWKGSSLVLQSEFRPRDDDRYHVNDLVQFHDRDFVENAYRAILKRPPDTSGFNSYLESLQTGKLDKIGVLSKLRFSPEGKVTRARIDGLRLPALLRSAGNFPIVGYLVQLVAELIRLPTTVRRQRQLEAHIFARQQQIADHINHQAAELSVVLQSAHARIAETLQCLAEASETLTAQQRQINHLRTNLETTRDEMRARLIEFGERMKIFRDRDVPDSQRAMVEEERHKMDAFYAAFTEAFRGARADVKERLKVYLPIIKKGGIGTNEMPILDLGCGRGEWLELLREENLKARGVDLNGIFVAQSQERGFDVVEEDLISHLRSLPDASLGAVTSFHVVEHLPAGMLMKMLDETVRVLKPGGVVIFETPNPQNVNVGSYAFYLDVSHHRPLPVPTMRFLFESRGLKRIEVIGLQEAADKVEGESDLINRFNFFFYGSMDYAIVGWKVAG